MDDESAAILFRATPLQTPEHGAWSDELKLTLVRRVIEAVGNERRAWGSMRYMCAGKKPRPGGTGCGWWHTVYMAVGIEGPPLLKRHDLALASPFMCGSCPQCSGMLAHHGGDETWNPWRPIPANVAHFRLPTVEEARVHLRTGYWGAEYVDPTGRTTALQRQPNRRERRRRR